MPRPKGWRKAKPMDIQEAKVEEKPIVMQSQPETRTHLTAEEAALQSIVQSEKDSWLGLTDADIEDFSLSEDPFKLPKEAQQLQERKEFAFRWCERKATRVLELQNTPVPFRWWICNATTCPTLARHCDSIDGGIHNRDQILLIKPWWMAEKVKQLKNAVDEARGKARDPKNRAGQQIDQGLEFVSHEQARITGRDFIRYDEESDDSFIDSGERSITA